MARVKWEQIEVHGLAVMVLNPDIRKWLMGDLDGAVIDVEGAFVLHTCAALDREIWRLVVVLASPPRDT